MVAMRRRREGKRTGHSSQVIIIIIWKNGECTAYGEIDAGSISRNTLCVHVRNDIYLGTPVFNDTVTSLNNAICIDAYPTTAAF